MDIVDRMFKLVDANYQEQKDFAADIGVHPTRVSEWRRRKSASYVKRLEIISKKLGTSPQYLLLGEEPESEKENVPESDTLSEESLRLLTAYQQAAPELQAAVRRVLGLE